MFISCVISFSREIKVEKMNISSKEKDTSIFHLQKICYSKDITEYNVNVKKFEECVGGNVFSYFKRNWDTIKEQWVIGLREHEGMFLNYTNNRIESANSHVKKIIPLYSSFEEFFKKFFVYIDCTRIERDNIAIKEMLKTPQIEIHSDILGYSNYLTRYSFNMVKTE